MLTNDALAIKTNSNEDIVEICLSNDLRILVLEQRFKEQIDNFEKTSVKFKQLNKNTPGVNHQSLTVNEF